MKVAVGGPAKVNLWLRIGPLQRSGYHHLDTLFCALELSDTVTIRPASPGAGVRLRVAFAAPLVERPDLGAERDNLAVRAATAFAEQAGLEPDFEIDLVKRIPPGGGLGGGSTDAGAVLRALHRMHPGAVSVDALRAMAGRLGSDVPFCLGPHALAHGRGRGTELTPAPPLPPRTVLVVLPPFGVSTTDAYRWLDDDRRDGLLVASQSGGEPLVAPSWAEVEARAVNDFEPAVFRRHPELQPLRAALVSHGARPALLAGSGSTLFGVFDDPEAAGAAEADLRESGTGVRTLLTRTRSG